MRTRRCLAWIADTPNPAKLSAKALPSSPRHFADLLGQKFPALTQSPSWPLFVQPCSSNLAIERCRSGIATVTVSFLKRAEAWSIVANTMRVEWPMSPFRYASVLCLSPRLAAERRVLGGGEDGGLGKSIGTRLYLRGMGANIEEIHTPIP